MAARTRDHKPLKERARRLFRSRFHCSGCNRDCRGHRALNAHHLADHSRPCGRARKPASQPGGWASKPTGRAVTPCGWLGAAGLRDPRGKLTAEAGPARSSAATSSVRDLRQASRHDKQHRARRQRARRRNAPPPAAGPGMTAMPREPAKPGTPPGPLRPSRGQAPPGPPARASRRARSPAPH